MELEVYLKQMLHNEKAEFKEGQKEAIERLVRGERLLVVQKTGWGKSMVYFLTTKLIREKGFGPTIIISPLLALMRNQISAAKKMGLKAASINSDNQSEWEIINNGIAKNEYDVLFISPEKLANDTFRSNTLSLIGKGIGMLVIDEAHCISDWGHDFRPDYYRIKEILRMLTFNTPILATTATANKRVVEDICTQIGNSITTLRGSLLRDSLMLDCVNAEDESVKLAYIAQLVHQLDGSGIIYCATTSKCVTLVEWLKKIDIPAHYYFSSISNREEVEDLLINNELKVIVATNALGMGFDKPDIRYVIHYDKPGSLIQYYQEVGRAGRDGKNSHGILLNCNQDDEIQNNFINTSLHSVESMKLVLNYIEKSLNGLSEIQLSQQINLSKTKIASILKNLQVRGFILKTNYQGKVVYKRTPNIWVYDEKRMNDIKKNKKDEFIALNTYTQSENCLMNFIQYNLDDTIKSKCGKCKNCKGDTFIKDLDVEILKQAKEFIDNRYISIKIKKKWPNSCNIRKDYLNNQGLAMSVYKQGEIGRKVYIDRYENEVIGSELIDQAVEFITTHNDVYKNVKWVTCVPSLRNPNIVPDFARKVASKLNLPFEEIIFKIKETDEQKDMRNSYKQQDNIVDAFAVNTIDKSYFSEDVLLIDDIVNSGWTFTICGYRLREKGSGNVIPFALAGIETGGV